MSKRQWIKEVFQGKKVNQVPIGFWYHFTSEEDWTEGLNDPSIAVKNIQGHKHFVETVHPDFVKLMSDGFFDYPNPIIHSEIKSIEDLAAIQSIGEKHPWFDQQVSLVQSIKENFPEDIFTVYNIFAPATYLKWKLAGQVSSGDDILADFIKSNPKLTQHVLDVIGQDIAILVERLIKEADVDGIYLSVQTLQDQRVTKSDYLEVVRPSEVNLLEVANGLGGLNILHICGYEGATNDLSLFVAYPSQVVNWATGIEKLSLADGKSYFGDKVVLGGFDNTKAGLLYQGSQEAIQSRVREILDETAGDKVIIGADCTIPDDINLEHLQWVREVLVK
ncbi:uroporphyrinogen decarboxylase family protein [Streptococcus sp. SGI.013]|uniref:uroporphyrinogen decarboxylase family protein n=1 Tax=unclassified Streptococcus TaxID=2608887 RepID=UPI003D034B52